MSKGVDPSAVEIFAISGMKSVQTSCGCLCSLFLGFQMRKELCMLHLTSRPALSTLGLAMSRSR